MRRFFRITLLLTSFLLACQFVSGQHNKILIHDITVYTSPGSPPIKHATIIIENGKFRAVVATHNISFPPGYHIINGQGKYATAGYWNSHVHFMESKWSNAAAQPAETLTNSLQGMLVARGFVYAFDLAALEFSNLNALRKRIASREVKGPTILAVGVPFTSKSPYYIQPAVLPEVKTRSEIDKHIREQIRQGANGIKTWSASPTGKNINYLEDSLIQAAATLTRKNNIPLFAHPSNNAGMLKAVRNGVTVLTHVSPDDRIVWDAATVSEMVKAKVALIPTLQLYAWASEAEGLPQDNLLTATAVGQLAAFHKAGGTVLFGTDVGYMTEYDPALEYVLMQKAGMSFNDILASLTTNPAQRFKPDRPIGKVAPGFEADLVILSKDPAEDVRNFTSVVYVFHKGTLLFRQQ